MNSKSVTCVAMMLASYPIARLIPFPLVGATLFSVMCAAFIMELRLWKVCLIYLPLYFSIMWDSLVWMPSFLANLGSNFYMPTFFCSVYFCFVFVFFEIVFLGLTKLFGAKLLLKKIGFSKRLSLD